MDLTIKNIKPFSLSSRYPLAVKLICILLLSVGVTSCGEGEDGVWDPMKWTTEASMNKKGEISAPATGDTYVFTCKNYSGFGISEVYEETSQIKLVYYERDENCGYSNFKTQWGEVRVVKNQLTVDLYPNQSAEKREYKVTVWSGDIYCTFTFEQAGK